jgi:hypothetical protein
MSDENKEVKPEEVMPEQAMPEEVATPDTEEAAPAEEKTAE